MNVKRILVILALIFAVIATLLGFDVLHEDGTSHVLGWVALSLACFYASLLA